jgi:hypothetical protein
MGQCSSSIEDRCQAHNAWVVSSAKASRCIVVFHNLFPDARREGATELGLPEEEVICERKREYDRFAEYGRVPPRQMLADGFWFDCAHCGARIQGDNPHTPLSNIVVDSDGEVFCQAECAVAHEPIRLKRNQRFESFKKKIRKRYPDLNFFNFHGGYPHRFDRAQFEFPGGAFPGTLQEVEEGLSWCISEVDAKSWQNYVKRRIHASS